MFAAFYSLNDFPTWVKAGLLIGAGLTTIWIVVSGRRDGR